MEKQFKVQKDTDENRIERKREYSMNLTAMEKQFKVQKDTDENRIERKREIQHEFNCDGKTV